MAKIAGAETPSMRQFRLAKEAHPDALVFFRMGDFYELFYEDAVVASKAVDITLTSRNKGSPDEIPMAGVPHHAASSYLQRLLDQGFKVAICEQMADPKTVKGIVPREVVRVVSPGIAYDDAGVPARANQFLVALDADAASATFGIAAVDVSTGEFLFTEVLGTEAALAELFRLDPRELRAGAAAKQLANEFAKARPKAFVRLEAEGTRVAQDVAVAELEKVFGQGETAPAAKNVEALAAAARALRAAITSDPRNAPPFALLVYYAPTTFLQLDESTQRHLELVRTLDGDTKASLLAQLDETKTPMGSRLLRRQLLSPVLDTVELRRRFDAVETFVTQAGLRRDLREALGSASDIERIAVKVLTARVAPRDLVLLRTSLHAAGKVRKSLDLPMDLSGREALAAMFSGATFDPRVDLVGLLERAVADEVPVRASDGGVIREGYDRVLDDARALRTFGQQHIASLETKLRDEAEIPSLKVRYTRVFGWYLEVTRTHAAKAPKAWRRKQTVATGERYTCDELDQLADALTHAEERAEVREAELLSELVASLAKEAAALRELAAQLAVIDVSCSHAEIASARDYVRPVVDDSLALDIRDGRHPVVERLAASTRFVPNDCVISAENRFKRAADAASDQPSLVVITGPNMAGKSTFMRQNALIVLMAQIGSFVPARSARIGVCDRIATRVGASDNLAKGESTFMVEMKETALVLRRSTRRSLVVMDEIGRGTSTFDGLAIAWAVSEHLHDVIGCRTFFATHYHELTALADERDGIANFSVSAKEHDGELVFFHSLTRGAASRSYGVACAKLAGVPELVVSRARTLLASLEAGTFDRAHLGRAHEELAQGASTVSANVTIADPALPPGDGRGGRTKKSAPERAQLGLFAPVAAEHPVLARLRQLDIERLTPLEALTLLAALKGEASVSPPA